MKNRRFGFNQKRTENSNHPVPTSIPPSGEPRQAQRVPTSQFTKIFTLITLFLYVAILKLRRACVSPESWFHALPWNLICTGRAR